LKEEIGQDFEKCNFQKQKSSEFTNIHHIIF